MKRNLRDRAKISKPDFFNFNKRLAAEEEPANGLFCYMCNKKKHKDDFSSMQLKNKQDSTRRCNRHGTASAFNANALTSADELVVWCKGCRENKPAAEFTDYQLAHQYHYCKDHEQTNSERNDTKYNDVDEIVSEVNSVQSNFGYEKDSFLASEDEDSEEEEEEKGHPLVPVKKRKTVIIDSSEDEEEGEVYSRIDKIIDLLVELKQFL
jgi:hypothetical protein